MLFHAAPTHEYRLEPQLFDRGSVARRGLRESRGLTTNPTLMRKVGISDYESFAKSVLEIVRDKPISFEVFSDEFPEMRRQARKISGWQENVYVKIPITNTRGYSAIPTIKELVADGVQLNITAILTRAQVIPWLRFSILICPQSSPCLRVASPIPDRKSTRLNSSHVAISY